MLTAHLHLFIITCKVKHQVSFALCLTSMFQLYPKGKDKPENIVDGWNSWFCKDISAVVSLHERSICLTAGRILI